MSTQSQLLKAKNDSYKSASEASRRATDEYIKSLNEAYRKQVENARSQTQRQKSEIAQNYRASYDLNLINQLVGERKLAEKMSNLGLSDSGANATNLTALSVQRQNADQALNQQQAIDRRNLDNSLNELINKLETEKTEKTIKAQQELQEQNASLLTKLNTEYTKALADIEKKKAETAADKGKNLMNVYGKLYSIKGPENRLAFLRTVTAAGYITETQRKQLAQALRLEK